MNKTDLIDRLADELGSRRNAVTALEVLVDTVIREVASGGSVIITGFGVFESTSRAPRVGRNPNTGARVPVPATQVPRFRPGTYFRSVVEDPTSLPRDLRAGVRSLKRRVNGSARPDRSRQATVG